MKSQRIYWNPIATIPLYRPVLVYFPDVGVKLVTPEMRDDDDPNNPYMIFFLQNGYSSDLLEGWTSFPTHWMEIPKEPKQMTSHRG